jgi:hypothetical protein
VTELDRLELLRDASARDFIFVSLMLWSLALLPSFAVISLARRGSTANGDQGKLAHALHHTVFMV